MKIERKKVSEKLADGIVSGLAAVAEGMSHAMESTGAAIQEIVEGKDVKPPEMDLDGAIEDALKSDRESNLEEQAVDEALKNEALAREEERKKSRENDRESGYGLER